MNLAHTVCASCAIHTGHTQAHPGKPFHLDFRIRHSRQFDSLHDCILYTFLKKKRVFCEWYHFAKIFYVGLVVLNIEVFEISVIVMIAVCNRNQKEACVLTLKLPTSKTTFFLSFLFKVLLRAPAKLSPDYVSYHSCSIVRF